MAITRLRQGIRALLSWARPVDLALITPVLSPAQIALFRTMRRSEQQHSINVLQTLRARGHHEPPLMVAALLHDVGKSRAAYYLWDRVLVVLVAAAAPALAQQWGQHEPKGWYRPFAVRMQHPRWSAELVTRAGADPLAVELIARHAEHLDQAPQHEVERLLVALQAADDAN